MYDNLSCLTPEHNKRVKLTRASKDQADIIKRISDNFNSLSIILAITWLQIAKQKEDFMYLPCSQCLRDVALQARDLADDIEELAKLEEK